MALDETTKRINVGKNGILQFRDWEDDNQGKKLKAAAEIVPPTVVYGSLIKMMFPTIVYCIAFIVYFQIKNWKYILREWANMLNVVHRWKRLKLKLTVYLAT